MRDAGIIIVTLIFNKRKELLKAPRIFAPGVLDNLDDNNFLIKIASKIITKLHSKKENKIRHYIENIVFDALKHDIKNKPFIEVQIEYVDY